MQRLIASLAALSILGAIAAYSAGSAPQTVAKVAAPVQIQVEPRNPWTNLNFNNQQRTFQFAVITDRTGGHRPGVFATAVKKLNLLQPEFVVSVGDLIEGYSEDRGQWALEWSEFQGKVQQLQMPFFYVAGNHDISNPAMGENWKRKFGRSFYEFRYNDVLFLALNSEDPPKEEPFRFSPEQQQWVVEVLGRNQDARWTFVLMHKPAWTYPNDDHTKSGWAAIEQALGERPYTVFAGHKHNYARFVRNGRDYIMLATTGGASKLRGTSDGEFDHVAWVTMKETGPVIANIMLDGIVDKDIRTLPDPKPAAKK